MQLHLTCDQLHFPAPYPQSPVCSIGPHCALFQGPPHWILLAAYNKPLQFVESGAFVVSAGNATAVPEPHKGIPSPTETTVLYGTATGATTIDFGGLQVPVAGVAVARIKLAG
jgi:hypothetical protein